MSSPKHTSIFQFYLIYLVTTVNCIYHLNQKDLNLVEMFEDVVYAENFTYFKLSLNGNILLRLHSISGDADLYVSHGSEPPTWQEYAIKSTTCGVDSVIIDSSARRPIKVGVYGHVAHQMSEFILEVFLDISDVSEDFNFSFKNESKPKDKIYKILELSLEVLSFVFEILFEVLL